MNNGWKQFSMDGNSIIYYKTIIHDTSRNARECFDKYEYFLQ